MASSNEDKESDEDPDEDSSTKDADMIPKAKKDEDPDDNSSNEVAEIIPKAQKQPKTQTSIKSHFLPKRKRGRPRKKVTAVPVKLPGSNAQPQEDTPPPAKKRRKYVNWSSKQNWPTVLLALITRRNEKHLPEVDKGAHLSAEASCIPRQTLTSIEKHLGNLPITRENCFETQTALLSLEYRGVLQDMIVNRDRMNTGMAQKEVIQNISKMGPSSILAVTYHFNYLVRMKLLPELKRYGCVSKAQPTTRKRKSHSSDM